MSREEYLDLTIRPLDGEFTKPLLIPFVRSSPFASSFLPNQRPNQQPKSAGSWSIP